MRRQNTQSSFDLFLDTVCNTFGGILFIAILIAIQIRQVEAPTAPESCSPEQIAELLHRVDELVIEIQNATVLLETVRKTIPEPIDENEKNLVAAYSELLDRKNALVAKKSELTRDCLACARENAAMERDLKKIEEKLRQLEAEEMQRIQEVQNLQNEQPDLPQKADKVQDKNDPDKNSRKETLYLPKMQDSGHLRPYYLVLRFNRLYVVERRDDFNYRGNMLGVPKKNRGLYVVESDAVRLQIRGYIRSCSPSGHFIGIFVYGDSVDSFHIVRDTLIAEGFRYELIPSPDDAPWSFGGGSGSTQVQ